MSVALQDISIFNSLNYISFSKKMYNKKFLKGNLHITIVGS